MTRKNRYKKEQTQEKGQSMKLTIAERFQLASLLPDKESFAGMTEISRLKIHLALTEEEAKHIDLRQEGGGIRWNNEKAAQLIKDIPMGEWMTNIIRDILRQKNEQHQVTELDMSLYEKFVVDYGLV